MARVAQVDLTHNPTARDSVWCEQGKRLVFRTDGPVYFSPETPPCMTINLGDGKWRPCTPGGLLSAPRPTSEVYMRSARWNTNGTMNADSNYTLPFDYLVRRPNRFLLRDQFLAKYAFEISDEKLITNEGEGLPGPLSLGVTDTENHGLCLGEIFSASQLAKAEQIACDYHVLPWQGSLASFSNLQCSTFSIQTPTEDAQTTYDGDYYRRQSIRRAGASAPDYEGLVNVLRGTFVWPGPFNVYDVFQARFLPTAGDGCRPHLRVTSNEKQWASMTWCKEQTFSAKTYQYPMIVDWKGPQMVSLAGRLTTCAAGHVYLSYGHYEAGSTLPAAAPDVQDYNNAADLNFRRETHNGAGDSQGICFSMDAYSGVIAVVQVAVWEP